MGYLSIQGANKETYPAVRTCLFIPSDMALLDALINEITITNSQINHFATTLGSCSQQTLELVIHLRKLNYLLELEQNNPTNY